MKTIFYHRGRGGHRGYSEGSIFTHASDTDRLNVGQKKCRKFFSFLFLSSVSSASSVVKNVMNLLLCLFLLSSCYYRAPLLDSEELSEKTKDSLAYLYERHYTWDTNLEVVDDSIALERLPIKDTFIQLNKGDKVVVAEFAIHPADSVDSVWVKLAHTQDEQGWIREVDLKRSFVPTDSISQAIHLFSDTHASYFVVIFALFVGVYLLRAFRKKQLQMVYFNDIDSIYPLFLCLLMAFSATIYESMQVFVPETWEHFYFNPTLSPFTVPFILSVFLFSIWLFLIVALAVLDDLFRQLTPAAAIFYLLGLMSCCIFCYFFFILMTHIYIGYLFLIFFMVTSTLINPNALKLLLPKSTHQTSNRPTVVVSIDKNLNFYLNTKVTPFSRLEGKIVELLKNSDDPCISIEAEKSVPIEQVVRVMNIAKTYGYKSILATEPE